VPEIVEDKIMDLFGIAAQFVVVHSHIYATHNIKQAVILAPSCPVRYIYHKRGTLCFCFFFVLHL